MSIGPTPTGRHCFQCGAWLNNTFLLHRRNYRCASCGAGFQHIRGLNQTRGEAVPRPRFWLRALVASAMAGSFVALAYYFSEVPVEVIPSIGAALATLLVLAAGKRVSRDPKLLAGAPLVFAALGTLIGFLVFTDESDLEETGQLPFMIVAWLGLGTFFCFGWLRAFRFPGVDETGVIPDEDDAGPAESTPEN